MANNTQILGELSHLDPKAHLSNKDLAILLLIHCSIEIRENIKEERDDTDAKFETTIKGLCNEIVKLRDQMHLQVSDQAKQIAELETKLSELENSSNSANICSDLDLKITSYSSYLEQLIFSLKQGLQDTFFQIDKDIKSIKYCELCNKNLPSHCVSSNHQNAIHEHGDQTPSNSIYQSMHQSTPPCTHQFQCKFCGNSFRTSSQLKEHIVFVHEVQPIFHCNLCNLTFTLNSDLDFHIKEFHCHAYQDQDHYSHHGPQYTAPD